MATTNTYAGLNEFQAWVKTNDASGFTSYDEYNLEISLEAASRWLDDHFGTSFYARTETKYLTARWSDLCYVPDLLTVTTLKTDDDEDGTYEITWATTDYWLEPRNAGGGSQPKPYRQIRTNINGDYGFPTHRYGVEIAGTWGYSALANVPREIKLATIMLAHRWWKRKDSVFGVAGAPALGVQIIQAQIQADSDIAMLLEGVDRRAI